MTFLSFTLQGSRNAMQDLRTLSLSCTDEAWLDVWGERRVVKVSLPVDAARQQLPASTHMTLQLGHYAST